MTLELLTRIEIELELEPNSQTAFIPMQIFHYVRSRELRAVTLLGRAFKYQLVRRVESFLCYSHHP